MNLGPQQPGDAPKDIAQGPDRFVPMSPPPPDNALGRGWNHRLHLIYMPIFTVVNLAILYAFVGWLMHNWFPIAKDSFLGGGGTFRATGSGSISPPLCRSRWS